MDKENLKTRVHMAFNALVNANDKALNDLINIVRDAGGMLLTPYSTDKPSIWAYTYNSPSDEDIEIVPIQAIAYDENEGLMVITDTEMRNYEYDNGYEFEYFYDFEGTDKEHYDDLVKDITYFRELNDGYTDVRKTVFSILAGLEEYLA